MNEGRAWEELSKLLYAIQTAEEDAKYYGELEEPLRDAVAACRAFIKAVETPAARPITQKSMNELFSGS